ncbi:MAG: glycosyltransferase [Anaerolineae bacterium]|nr:glycosyltransferase [Anaerolineae bacterium]
MRILHVYKNYAPIVGGIENHLKLLAERQAAAGHEVTVLVSNVRAKTAIETQNGVRVIKAARLAHLASTPLGLALPLHLARQRPDIAHLHFPYPLGELAQHLLGRSRATVVTYHSDVVRQRVLLRFYRPLMEHILAAVDRIIVSTPNYLDSSEILGPLRNKCCVIPFGIDREPFLTSSRESAQTLRATWGDGPVLLFVGVLRYYKGLQHLIQAMPRISARLVVVGEGPFGPALRQQVCDLGLSAKVVFAGRVSDAELPTYYRAADLFVLPASERSEAFGLVQVEAMSSGLPVVSTELGTGTSYVNQDGVSGLVVPPRDPPALAVAIMRLLSDDALRDRLACGALAHSAHFSAERMLAEIEAVYRELLP